MNVFIARFIAAILAPLVVSALAALGVPLTEDDITKITELLTTSFNALGMIVTLAFYALVHKLTSKKTNPADTAKAPELAANRIGANL